MGHLTHYARFTVQVSLFSKVLAERDLEDAVELTADIGYDGIEFMGRDPHLSPGTSHERARELKSYVDRHDLDVPCIATYCGAYVEGSERECRANLEELERLLELAEILDCEILRHGPSGTSPWKAADEDFEVAARWMREAADLAAEYDKTLGIEIHAQKLAETTDSTLRLLELIERDNVGAILDSGNMYLVDEDYGRDAVQQLGDSLVHLHVKDEAPGEDPDHPDTFSITREDGPARFRASAMGEGEVEHDRLFAALAEAGYDSYVTAEAGVSFEEPDGDAAIAEHELAELRQLIAAADDS
jgi:sugar phosphate isomerase/epimerase